MTRSSSGLKSKKYVLSIGRSNRDFNFLVSAWKNINFHLVIISDRFKLNKKENEYKNITVLNNISGDLQYPFFIHSSFIIIPIDDGKICSGDTVLLQAMSFQKLVIVTSPSTLGEMYILNEYNGLLVEKNIDIFRKKIISLLDVNISEIEKKARQHFLEHFSRYQMGKNIGNKINILLNNSIKE